MVRSLLILVLVLATSFSGAMADWYTTSMDHPHSIDAEVTAEIPGSDDEVCCESGDDAIQTCHQVPNLTLSASGCVGLSPTTDDNRFRAVDFFMTGTMLSGPLKPPRLI